MFPSSVVRNHMVCALNHGYRRQVSQRLRHSSVKCRSSVRHKRKPSIGNCLGYDSVRHATRHRSALCLKTLPIRWC